MLRASERLFRVDFTYLLKEGRWLLVAKIFTSLLAFGLAIVYANLLTKEIYGNYRYVLSLISILGFFSLPGLGTAITRAVAKGKTNSYPKGLRLRITSSFLISLASFFIGAYFILRGNSVLGSVIIFSGLLAPLTEGTGSFLSYFDGTGQFKRKSFWNVIVPTARALAILGAIFLSTQFELNAALTLFSLIAAYFLPSAVLHFLIILRTIREIPQNAPAENDTNRYGIHLTLMNIPSTIATYLDGILLFSFLGPTALAAYSFALAPSEQIKGLLKVADVLAFPRLVLGDEEKLKKTLPRKALLATFFILIIFLGYYVLAPYFYQIFFPQYSESVNPSQIFMLSLLGFPAAFFLSALQAQKRVRALYFYNVAFPVFEIILLILLIPAWGLWGAVWARTISRLGGFVILGILFKSKI